MPRFENSILINRPPEQVWTFMTDMFNAPRMRPGFLGWRQTSPGPLGAGSTMQGRAVILGMEARLNAQFVEWDPPHGWVVTITGRPFHSTDRVTLERIGNATRISRSSEFEPHPVLKLLLWPFYPTLVRRQHRAVFENAKRLLESQPR